MRLGSRTSVIVIDNTQKVLQNRLRLNNSSYRSDGAFNLSDLFEERFEICIFIKAKITFQILC